jgi:hypothetical protein
MVNTPSMSCREIKGTVYDVLPALFEQQPYKAYKAHRHDVQTRMLHALFRRHQHSSRTKA